MEKEELIEKFSKGCKLIDGDFTEFEDALDCKTDAGEIWINKKGKKYKGAGVVDELKEAKGFIKEEVKDIETIRKRRLKIIGKDGSFVSLGEPLLFLPPTEKGGLEKAKAKTITYKGKVYR